MYLLASYQEYDINIGFPVQWDISYYDDLKSYIVMLIS